MTDLVSQLVGALERVDAEWSSFWPLGPDVPSSSDRICAIAPETAEIWRAIRAALTAAKAGGWVAVPGEPTPEMLKAGETAYWQKVRDVQSPTPTEFYDECGGPIGYAWTAMLATRPLPNPPKEQA